MICPACGKDALIVEYKDIELDYCPACRGVWFDAGELEMLLEAAGLGSEQGFLKGVADQPETQTAEKTRRCPDCRRKMKKVTIDDEKKIITDICINGHGIWFDGGEVNVLVKALAEKSPAKEDAKRVLGFIGEIFKY